MLHRPTRTPRPAGLALAALAAAVFVAPSLTAPAAADWLVMNDGTRVEIVGPWEQRGGLLVFTLPGGTLSSLRVGQVDLEASRLATEEAARPPEPVVEPAPEPEAKAKAKHVFTEKELPPVIRAETEGSPEAEGAATAGTGETAAAGDDRLQVTDWNVVTPDEFDGSRVVGRIRNVGDVLLTSVAMEVRAFNASGTPVGRAMADVSPGPVPPDRVIDFTADFPTVYGITAVKFNLRGSGFLEDSGESDGDGTTAEAASPESSATAGS